MQASGRRSWPCNNKVLAKEIGNVGLSSLDSLH